MTIRDTTPTPKKHYTISLTEDELDRLHGCLEGQNWLFPRALIDLIQKMKEGSSIAMTNGENLSCPGRTHETR